MMKARTLTLLAICALAGCSGGSGSNPFGSLSSANPFARGNGSDAQSMVASDGRVRAPGLTEALAEQALRGVILRATAFAPRQGYFDAVLVAQNEGVPDANGIVSFEFRVHPPEATLPVGAPGTRQLLAAVFLSDDALRDIRGLRVIGADKVISLRR